MDKKRLRDIRKIRLVVLGDTFVCVVVISPSLPPLRLGSPKLSFGSAPRPPPLFPHFNFPP
ncbi:hypothetical protein LY76DRAFT_121269 [Colletotrichum caudatum]|nr:hypothetical protein LY76DRAFT_121269 [Colletotrichum caudatum]